MGETLEMPRPPTGEEILDYPPEHLYFRFAAPAAVGLHLLVALSVILLAYFHHVRSLQDMMTASLSQPPVQQIEILLIDENKPPPPTANPVWIKQLIIPKVKPPPPPPPKPKPKPKPVPARIVPRLIVGSNNLPVPTYPIEAYQAHIEGTVMVQVTFDGTGSVENADVVESSGSALLDSGARHFILENWRSKAFAGQTQTVPIRYQFPH